MTQLSAIALFIFTMLPFVHAEDQQHYWLQFKAKDKFERTRVANLGLEIESMVEDLVSAIGTAEDLKNAKKSGLLVNHFLLSPPMMLDFPDEDSQFHNYNELKNELILLAEQNPGLVTLSSIGPSVEGRDLMLLTLTNGGNHQTKPAVFYMGGHHAREHVSIEIPLLWAQYLVQEFRNNNPRIVQLLSNRTVYIVPLVNPDGAEYDIATGAYRLWRKNRKNNGRSFGVDLNRNYGYQWGGGGASTSPNNDTYRGPTPFSEPETQAIKNFMETHTNISINLTFHTFSKLILYPWGHKYDHIENQNAYLVHKNMAEKMAQWNGYKPQQSSELYIASGDTTDWAFGQLGMISFTFELDPVAQSFMDPRDGFYPGQDQIQPTFKKNLEPCLYLLEYADNPYRVLQSKSEKYGFQSPIL